MFAARGDDQRGNASEDIQVALIVDVAESPGAKPAVGGEHLGSLLGQVMVASEDVRPAGEDLALWVSGLNHVRVAGLCLLGLGRGINADLDARNGSAGTLDFDRAGQVPGQERSGFGEPVAGDYLPAEALKFPRQVRGKCRAARGEQAELRPEPLVQRT